MEQASQIYLLHIKVPSIIDQLLRLATNNSTVALPINHSFQNQPLAIDGSCRLVKANTISLETCLTSTNTISPRIYHTNKIASLQDVRTSWMIYTRHLAGKV